MADPTRSLLAILAGAPTGRYVLPPSGELLIGSDAACPLRIAAPGVSPQQAVLRLGAGGAFLRDLGTPTGVYVNERRVEGEQALHDGDRIWLGTPKAQGSVLMQCRLATPAQIPAPTPAPLQPEAQPRPQPQAPSASAPQPQPGPPPADDFFVGEAPSVAPAPAAAADEGFIVGEEPVPVATVADDFFVGGEQAAVVEVTPEPEPEDDGGLAQPAAAPVAADEFFVGEEGAPPVVAPPVPTVPASDDFFVADEAPAPSAGIPVAPTPAPPSSRPTAAPPSPGPRPARPSPVPVAMPPSPRPAARLAGPPSAHPPRAAHPRGGLPGFVLPLAAALVLAFGAAGAYLGLMVVGRPEIRSIDPQRANVGDVVVLEGQRFATAASDNVVLFGVMNGEVVAASPTRLEVRIPDTGLAPGEEKGVPVRVKVGRKVSPLASLTVRQTPRIRGLSLESAQPGEEVLIAGGGWAISGTQVLLGETSVTPAEVTATYVRVRIPPMTTGRVLSVVVVSGSERSSAAELVVGRLPALASIEPGSASPGTLVTFAGRGFAGAGGDYSVRIGGAAALVVGSAAGNVRAIVPSQAAAGESPVEIRIRGQQGVATGNLTLGPAPDPIPFRFVAEPLGELAGRAALVSGLGVVLGLADAGGRPAAERAEEAMRRLDAAGARLAAGVAPEFQVRPAASASVIVLAGSEEPLLEVTDADAAACAADAAGRVRGPVVTRGRLAVWWAAVLGDMALLLKGEPTRYVPATSPEGRVLADVQKTVAQTGAAGVTQVVLAALKPGTRDQLRVLALRVPAAVREP